MVTSSPQLEINKTQSLGLGRKGEQLAAAYLAQLGFQLVAANFTVPAGRNRNDVIVNVELDLVAYEGPVLCFVEVKTRTSDWFASPTANVDLRKQRQITRGAGVYRRMFGLEEQSYRFDVISVIVPPAEVTGDAPARTESKARREAAQDPQVSGLQIELRRKFWSPDKFRKQSRYQVPWD